MNIRIIPWLCLSLLLLFSSAASAESVLSRFFEKEEAEAFLPVEQAFQVQLLSATSQQAQLKFGIVPGHYLYRARISATVPDGQAGAVAALDLPPGEEKIDPNFGTQQVFHHDFVATAHFRDAMPAKISVRYQGCSEKGLCYPPQTHVFDLPAQSGAGEALPVSSTTQASTAPPLVPADAQASEDGIARLLQAGHWWQVVAGFFGAGLLLAFTPCVFPMIPILSGIIIGKNAHVSRTKAFTLSLAYTMGMCLTYTLAGVAAGLSGQLLSSALQTPAALITGALLFVGLSLSMFGFYELKLPSALENAFFNWSHRFKGGHLFSDFLMGAISALIISPCVAAPLAGALLYISQTHDVALGAMALFSLSFGMGVPLLMIGASAGSVLPKAGAWMNAVRQLFGVLMLAVAVWVVSPILPVAIQMVLWAALCIVPAIYLRAIDPLPVIATTSQRLLKGLALMLLVYGIAVLIGAWTGARSPLQPLQGLLGQQANHPAGLVFRRVQTLGALEAAVTAAHGQPVMLDFYADWCVSCKEYEQFVFADPNVAAKLGHMQLLQADVTANTAEDAALLKQFGLFGPPGLVFYDAQGRVIHVVKGYQDAAQFLRTLQQLGVE